jgi:hypothetical protein
LGTVPDPDNQLEETVKIVERNFITVDFPALQLNVSKDK